jgi:uncharacterized protein YqhQ
LTTREPDDEQLEVALTALKAVLAKETVPAQALETREGLQVVLGTP